tara:strand:- start:865 stop:1428 length:564 start_codon:yes stop_codon:yes gene_type:complete
MFASFARAITSLNRWIGRIAAWVVIPLFLLLLCDVVMRYFAGRPLIWTSETAQLVFAVYGTIAGGWLLAERGHVNVDIFYGTFSPRRKAIADLSTCFLFLLFVGVLLWQGLDLAIESYEKLERSNSAWKPQIWFVKFFIPVSALLLFLQGIVRIVADVRVLMGLPVPDDVYGAPASYGPAHGEEGEA